MGKLHVSDLGKTTLRFTPEDGSGDNGVGIWMDNDRQGQNMSAHWTGEGAHEIIRDLVSIVGLPKEYVPAPKPRIKVPTGVGAVVKLQSSSGKGVPITLVRIATGGSLPWAQGTGAHHSDAKVDEWLNDSEYWSNSIVLSEGVQPDGE